MLSHFEEEDFLPESRLKFPDNAEKLEGCFNQARILREGYKLEGGER